MWSKNATKTPQNLPKKQYILNECGQKAPHVVKKRHMWSKKTTICIDVDEKRHMWTKSTTCGQKAPHVAKKHHNLYECGEKAPHVVKKRHITPHIFYCILYYIFVQTVHLNHEISQKI